MPLHAGTCVGFARIGSSGSSTSASAEAPRSSPSGNLFLVGGLFGVALTSRNGSGRFETHVDTPSSRRTPRRMTSVNLQRAVGSVSRNYSSRCFLGRFLSFGEGMASATSVEETRGLPPDLEKSTRHGSFGPDPSLAMCQPCGLLTSRCLSFGKGSKRLTVGVTEGHLA